MATYIRCPECGNYLGPYIKYFDVAKKALYEEKIFKSGKYANYAPDKMVFNPNITPSLEIIFDALNINLRCCRTHIFAKSDFDEKYYHIGKSKSF
jgi:DNA-directed RNA polymerase subunit N (RpoN/RPB10)